MLLELNVSGFGIIEAIAWHPAGGLNVITGETGAGKSLVVDAVEALLSGQVAEEDIRHGAPEARLEGIFGLPEGEAAGPLRALLADKGLDSGEDTLLITCDARRRGRAVPRVNRQAVARALLQDIGARLVDIHGQSGHLSLLNREQHLAFLDDYAHTREMRRDFSAKAAALYQAEREIEALSRSEQDTARQLDLLNFQIDEIRRAGLQPGEEEALAGELARLAAGEKLQAAAYELYGLISGDDGPAASSAADRLGEAVPLLRQMAATDPSLQPSLDSLETALQGLAELAREIRAYGDGLEHDPQRLEEVQARLELIRTLKRKYGDSIGAVTGYLARAEKERDDLTFSGERRQQLMADIARQREAMGALASKLSGARRQAAQKLAGAVQKELGELAMSQVDFAVDIGREPSAEGLPLPDGQRYRFNASGIDSVEFMAATNPGEPRKPLAKIASTGEISRFMLALKGALAEADTIPVLIFDEIDIGVGGRSGEVIGRKLWNLSRHHQVICVTHLPQIAAFADAHYRVAKQTGQERTVSTITALEGEERRNELAAMLGGPDYSENARHAAAELLQQAEAWKSEAG